MSYADALAYLETHSNYDTTGRITSPTLDRMRALMAAMGDPQLAYPVIHVTGTNGKGSTTQMITRLLMAHGLSVGCLLSTSDAADDLLCVDLGGRRLIKKIKTNCTQQQTAYS